MTYNLPLRPQWETEETYDFSLYHVRGCDQSKCDGKCGQEHPVELRKEISLRRKKNRRTKKPWDKSSSSEQHLVSDAIEKVEEPGDEEFVVGTKDKPKVEGGTPKGRKKTVTFAE